MAWSFAKNENRDEFIRLKMFAQQELNILRSTYSNENFGYKALNCELTMTELEATAYAIDHFDCPTM